jgi:hypothetical protein
VDDVSGDAEVGSEQAQVALGACGVRGAFEVAVLRKRERQHLTEGTPQTSGKWRYTSCEPAKAGGV